MSGTRHKRNFKLLIEAASPFICGAPLPVFGWNEVVVRFGGPGISKSTEIKELNKQHLNALHIK